MASVNFDRISAKVLDGFRTRTLPAANRGGLRNVLKRILDPMAGNKVKFEAALYDLAYDVQEAFAARVEGAPARNPSPADKLPKSGKPALTEAERDSLRSSDLKLRPAPTAPAGTDHDLPFQPTTMAPRPTAPTPAKTAAQVEAERVQGLETSLLAAQAEARGAERKLTEMQRDLTALLGIKGTDQISQKIDALLDSEKTLNAVLAELKIDAAGLLEKLKSQRLDSEAIDKIAKYLGIERKDFKNTITALKAASDLLNTLASTLGVEPKGLPAKVAEIKAQLADAQAEVAALKRQLDYVQTTASASISAAQQDARKRIEEIQTAASALTASGPASEMTAITGNVNELVARWGTLQESILTDTGKLQELTASIDVNALILADLTRSREQISGRYQTEIDRVTSGEAEGAIGKLEAQPRLDPRVVNLLATTRRDAQTRIESEIRELEAKRDEKLAPIAKALGEAEALTGVLTDEAKKLRSDLEDMRKTRKPALRAEAEQLNAKIEEQAVSAADQYLALFDALRQLIK